MKVRVKRNPDKYYEPGYSYVVQQRSWKTLWRWQSVEKFDPASKAIAMAYAVLLANPEWTDVTK